ncbi:MAG: S1/P1 nuclease [Pseudomonadota bacterium]
MLNYLHFAQLKIILAGVLCIALSTLQMPVAWGWGPQGHRVAGAITWTYLSPSAREAVHAILGDQTLAEASTWADRMRSNPSPFWQETAGPYHYATVPPGQTYADTGPPVRGDAVTALQLFANTLLQDDAALVQKQLALRFALHIIQDLHQPLHVGNGKDRGGTRYWIKLHGKPTNLHRIWDTEILLAAKRSDIDWMRHLHFTEEEIRAGWSADPIIWIEESVVLRDKLYPKSALLDAEYLLTWLPEAERRLALSAVRGAAWIEKYLVPDDPG